MLRAERKKQREEAMPWAAEGVPVQQQHQESKFGAFATEDDYYFEYYRRLDAENQDATATASFPPPQSDSDSDETDGIGDAFDMALDVAHQFLMGPEWQSTIFQFIMERCNPTTFTPNDMSEGKFDHEHYDTWLSFREMAEQNVTTVLENLGLQSDMLVRRCRRVLRTKGNRQRRHASEVVRALLVIDDFGAFCRLVLDCQKTSVGNTTNDARQPDQYQNNAANNAAVTATPSAPPLEHGAANHIATAATTTAATTAEHKSSGSSPPTTMATPHSTQSTCTDKERQQLLDLPIDWSQQIHVARAIASKIDLDPSEQQWLIPWAHAALELNTHTDSTALSPEKLLALRSHVFLTRIDVDVFVAKKILQSSTTPPITHNATKSENTLMAHLNRQAELDKAVTDQRNIVLSTNDHLTINGNRYGEMYLYLQSVLRSTSSQSSTNDGRDIIPQRCGELVPQILKLLVLEAEQEHVIDHIRNSFEDESLSVPTEAPIWTNEGKETGDDGSSSSTEFMYASKTNEVTEFEDNDPFLDSIRYVGRRLVVG